MLENILSNNGKHLAEDTRKQLSIATSGARQPGQSLSKLNAKNGFSVILKDGAAEFKRVILS